MTSVTADVDVVIVGSGPAGVSAAFPLLDAGLRVLMVDGGERAGPTLPPGQLLDLRQHDADQWRWMVGDDFYALGQADAASPKLRVPTHAATFAGFAPANRIVADDFMALGSLAPGGLSNAWGCGVACLTNEELAAFPVDVDDMRASYGAVARRIGISGGRNDDLSTWFGLDDWSQPAIAMDAVQGGLLARYERRRAAVQRHGLRLGRARVAVLSEALQERRGCDLSGTCLWGCERGALYSARSDLQQLQRRVGFSYRPGFVVERVMAGPDDVAVVGQESGAGARVRARRVLLAAGTLASTRLALEAIDHRAPVPLQSCPTAAFLLWLPRHFGRAPQPAFGLGQLSFALGLSQGVDGFGSLFGASAIPLTEFAAHAPLGKRYVVDLLAPLLTSCVVGNVFLPGSLMEASLCLDNDAQLVVRGAYRDEVSPLMTEARRRLGSAFRRLGALLVPTSFTIGRPGSDIHYAASLPMRAAPVAGETDAYGELVGAAGVHVVDGASLSALPAKSHTLTIMANADRIGRSVAGVLVGGRSVG